jgi:hypothetical protein
VKPDKRFKCQEEHGIDAGRAVHYVIGRGINRQAIFSDKKDYQNSLARLGDLFGQRLAMLL